MQTKFFSNREEFQNEIEYAMNNVDEDEIKKSIRSFTHRVREVERSDGKYIKKLV